MNQKFIHSALLGSLMLGLLAFGNFNANAAKNNHDTKNNEKSLSSTQFFKEVAIVNENQLPATFGLPDQIKTLKSADGNVEGVLWVYNGMVTNGTNKRDALFVLIDGKMKYATLA